MTTRQLEPHFFTEHYVDKSQGERMVTLCGIDMRDQANREFHGPPVLDMDMIATVKHGDVEFFGMTSCARCSDLSPVMTTLRRSSPLDLAQAWMLAECPTCDMKDDRGFKRGPRVTDTKIDLEAKEMTINYECLKGHAWSDQAILNDDFVEELATAPSA